MTDKEFKRLSRAQLIEIIYQFQLEVDSLTKQNEELEALLEDKRLRVRKAGNLAEAALEINDCFRSAQNAAEQYLTEIKLIRDETLEERKRILEQAKEKAEAIISNAKKVQSEYDSANELIPKE